MHVPSQCTFSSKAMSGGVDRGPVGWTIGRRFSKDGNFFRADAHYVFEIGLFFVQGTLQTKCMNVHALHWHFWTFEGGCTKNSRKNPQDPWNLIPLPAQASNFRSRATRFHPAEMRMKMCENFIHIHDLN